MNSLYIQPEWPAPSNIKAFSTLRRGGVSLPPYNELNLGNHVGDSIDNVAQNSIIIQQEFQLPTQPIWIKQTHSNIAIPASTENRNKEADASYTNKLDTVCVVLTADCLPILLCDRQGGFVSAIHAGWRGLSNGIIQNTLKAIPSPKQDILAWLGPAIGPTCFEVGEEVRQIFLDCDIDSSVAFLPSKNNRWLCNIYTLARLQLKKQNIAHIYGGDFCTFSDAERFFSYRRDGARTGRMASLIWISGL